MKILVGVRGDAADSYYRARVPFSIIKYVTGHEVRTKVPATGDVDQGYQVAFLQRICDSVGEYIGRKLKDKGIRIIYDVDDNFWLIPPSWGGVYDAWYERGDGSSKSPLFWVHRMIELADVVTVPSQGLAEKVREYHPDVRVIPNYVLRGDWDTVVVQTPSELERPVVGWFGMPYYWDAWRDAAPFVAEAMRKMGGTLVILGYPEVTSCFPEDLVKRTYVAPQVHWSEFDSLRSLIAGWDIGIIPLDDTLFNWSKSWLKALQFGAARVPVVASRVVYSQVLEHGVTGLLAKESKDFARLLPVVWEDTEARYLMASQWQAVVLEEHIYETKYRQWLDLVEEVADR